MSSRQFNVLAAMALSILLFGLMSCTSGVPQFHDEYLTKNTGSKIYVYSTPESTRPLCRVEAGMYVDLISMDSVMSSFVYQGDTVYIKNYDLWCESVPYTAEEIAEMERQKEEQEELERIERNRGKVDLGLFAVEWYWLVLAGVGILLWIMWYIEATHDFVGWLIFIPVPLVVYLVLNVFGITNIVIDGIVGGICSIAPYWLGLIIEAIVEVLGILSIIHLGSRLCPNRQVGTIALSVVCFVIMVLQTIYMKKTTVFPFYVSDIPPEIDVIRTIVVFCVFGLYCYIAIFDYDYLFSKDDSDD